MRRFILMFAIIALITSCRSQQCTVHDAQCMLIRDSVSVTYHPGTVLSLTDSTDSTDCAPTYGGAITVKPQHDGLTSQAQRCFSARPLQIPQKVRIDTLIVERWHAEVCQPQAVCQRSGPSAEGGLSAKRSQFYKNCTLGFWILLILLLGSFSFRILKAIYLKR